MLSSNIQERGSDWWLSMLTDCICDVHSALKRIAEHSEGVEEQP